MSEENQTTKPNHLIINDEIISRTRGLLMNATDRIMMMDAMLPVMEQLKQHREEFGTKIDAAVAATGLDSEQAVIDSGSFPNIVEALAKRQNLDDSIAQGEAAIGEARKIVSDCFTV